MSEGLLPILIQVNLDAHLQHGLGFSKKWAYINWIVRIGGTVCGRFLRIIYQMTSWLPLPMRKSEPLSPRRPFQVFKNWTSTNKTIPSSLGEDFKLTSAYTQLSGLSVPTRDTKGRASKQARWIWKNSGPRCDADVVSLRGRELWIFPLVPQDGNSLTGGI